jgi:hypothetical protein
VCRKTSPTGWSLAAGWQQTLREWAERGDILKQMHRAVSGDPARYHVVRAGHALPKDGSGGKVIVGRVAAKGLSDELKGALYAVIETPTGHAYHVPLDRRAAEGLRVGDLVSVANRRDFPGQPGPTPARPRLFVRSVPLAMAAQVAYPGPVWLDRLQSASLAPYGFGAKLRRAVAQRRDELRRLGVAPDDPARFEKLAELERAHVAKTVAETSGRSFLSQVPDGILGRADLRFAPSGVSYAVVSDDARFVVLKSPARMRRLQGRAVTVTRDEQERPVVRPTRERDLQ